MSQNSHRVSLQPAFILHGRDFRDTSRLLDVFTRDYGRVSLVAKGARSSRSKWQGILQPFSPLIISWSGKGEVQTLTDAEVVKTAIQLSPAHVMSAYYINEIVQRFTTFHDPHPELYSAYQLALESFDSLEQEWVLRRFEKQLLAEAGYGLVFDYESETGDAVNKDELYYYDFESGPVNVKYPGESDNLEVSGQTLIDLAAGNFTSAQTQKQAKQLMRSILSHHLGDKPLKTRSLHWYKPL